MNKIRNSLAILVCAFAILSLSSCSSLRGGKCDCPKFGQNSLEKSQDTSFENATATLISKEINAIAEE